MTARFLVVVVLAGCGRYRFDPLTDGAARDDARSADAPADACTFGPWGTPQPITELNTASIEFGGQITPDGLRLYFDSNRDGSEDMFVATRPDRSSPFNPPEKLLEIDTSADEGDATFSPDELELVFYQGTDNCLLDSRRAMPTDLWNIPTVTTICSSNGAFISRDGLTLYYNSLLDTSQEGVLYTTTRASTADLFTPGSPIPELMPGANKGYAALTHDELEIAFEMDGGTGSRLDVWFATRPTTSDPWSAPAKLTEINSTGNDGDPSFSADGTELFFESDRAGSPDLYRITRSCQ